MTRARGWRGLAAFLIAGVAVLVAALLAASLPTRDVALERFAARARTIGHAVAAGCATACAAEAKADDDLAGWLVDLFHDRGHDDDPGGSWSRGSSYRGSRYDLALHSDATLSTERFGQATRSWHVHLARLGSPGETLLDVVVRATWSWRVVPTEPRVSVTIDDNLSHNPRLLKALSASLDANGIRYRVEKPPP